MDHRDCGVEEGEKIRGPDFFWSALMGALYYTYSVPCRY